MDIEQEIRRLLLEARDYEQKAEACRKGVRELLRLLTGQSGDTRTGSHGGGRALIPACIIGCPVFLHPAC
jgi:hypothetical protein